MAIGFDDQNLVTDPNQWYASEVYTSGYLYEWQGNHYWFALVADVAVTEGWLVEWSSTLGSVTADRAGGSSIGRCPAGIATTAIPVGGYGFFQCSGTGAHALLTDGGVAAGEGLMPHATTNGGVDTMAAGSEESHFGKALADDASTVQAAGSYVLKECM